VRNDWDVVHDEHKAYTQQLVEAQIRLILRNAHVQECKNGTPILQNLQLLVHPVKKVIVLQPIATRQLRLVPVSGFVTCGEKVPPTAVDLGHMCDIGGTPMRAYISAHHRVAKKGEKEAQDWFAPFWHVTGTTNSNLVNMEFESVVHKVAGDDWISGDYKIPYLTNSKPLKLNDQLYHHVTGGPMSPRYPVVEKMPLKRQRRA
jgi:hypothetical protein